MPSRPPVIRPNKKEKQEHFEQARHNQGFLTHLLTEAPNHYYDWKVTVCFYIGLHWVRMFLCTRGVVSNSHQDTLDCINPKAAKTPAIHIPIKNLFDPYFALKQLSENARYNGFLQYGSFENLQKANLAKAQQCLELVKQELISQGLRELAPASPAQDQDSNH